MSHFIFPDERFTIYKFISLVAALVGVVLNAVPSFLHAGSSDETKNVTIGYVVLICGVIVQGVGMVYMKWKSPNTDITVSAMIQIGASAILCLIWSLIWDTPKVLASQSVAAPPMAWVWALIIGVLATGIAGHGYVFLVNNIGATGASFITFGQIFVGIVVGVAFVHEWSGYRWWEIFMCVIGVVALAVAIGIGFLGDKKPVQDISSMGEISSAEELERQDDIEDEYEENNIEKKEKDKKKKDKKKKDKKKKDKKTKANKEQEKEKSGDIEENIDEKIAEL
ncbi:hypothetical protein TRFO_37746 [Tritrichomonas foetus]|uniref:EamA domain-containing protein n=1 Tax=Tritrichomonas foetus TaxID=1144522 RepID=A0A1J4JAA6_9EUKA|nr:hypothetical protein TRFO_37746 [Tritrichomonas foetus]|eukprot:OHS96106.1 hypothetical protein TRFO_37746 [Tritrichomonas foetus]